MPAAGARMNARFYRTMRRFALVLALAAVGGSASALIWDITSVLDGVSEVPPNASPATGTVSGTYDDVTKLLTIDTMASGFVAPVTAAHIHKAPPGVAGPVVFPLSGTTGATSYTSHDMFVLDLAKEADLLGGMYYVNIHSSAFPGGEIRGQLHAAPVPEPASLAALGIGAAALLRRRKK